MSHIEATGTSLDLAEVVRLNPKVDYDLLQKAQVEMKSLGIQPAQYNLEDAFSRRSEKFSERRSP